jgi:hypothetical protein
MSKLLVALTPLLTTSSGLYAVVAKDPPLNVQLNTTDGTCAGSDFWISYYFTETVIDEVSGPYDYVGTMAYELDGTAIAELVPGQRDIRNLFREHPFWRRTRDQSTRIQAAMSRDV